MIHDNVLRLVLSGVFAVATAYFLVRVVSPTPLAERVSSAWHALTGAAMVAMLWSWGMSIPPILGILVFGAAALWFVFQAWSDRFGREVSAGAGITRQWRHR